MMFDDAAYRPFTLPPEPPRVSCPDLSLDATVNDVLRRHPHTGLVFNTFGVDACCGGAHTLVAAARAAGLEPAVLLDALASVVCPTWPDLPQDAAEGVR